MKKLFACSSLLALAALAFTGCTAQETKTPDTPAAPPVAATPAAATPAADAATTGTAAATPATAADSAMAPVNPKPKTGPLTIAVIPKSTGGDFWETVGDGAKAAAKELGVEIKWQGTLSETEFAEEAKLVENMVTLGVDGIALAPQNSQALRPAVESTVAAGIPVVVFDSAVDGTAHTSYIATDNLKGGKLGGEKLAALMGGAQGKKVMVLRLVQGSASTEQRSQGCIDALKAAGATIVADPYSEDSTIAGTKRTATNTLEGMVKDGKLDLDGIFACNMYTTQGMEGALDDLRKGGVQVNARFVGFDTNSTLIQSLQAGKIDALVAQNPRKMGDLTVRTLVKYLRGEQVETKVDTGVDVVTAEGLKTDAAMRQLVGLK